MVAKLNFSVGIIIPFYNGQEYIYALFQSLEKEVLNLNYKIFIVDNGSAKINKSLLDNLNLNFVYINTDVGIGYGKACNIGYEQCKNENYDYCLILNQDGKIGENMILNLVISLRKSHDNIVSVPILKEYDSNQVESFFIEWYLTQIPDFFSDLLESKFQNTYNLRKASGACFLFDLKKIEYKFQYLFDPIFYMYFEDEDLFRRIEYINKKIVLSSNSVFYHKHSNTTDTENQLTIHKNKILGQNIYFFKNLKKSYLLLLITWLKIEFVISVSMLINLQLKNLLNRLFITFKTFLLLGKIYKTRLLEEKFLF